MFFLIVKYTQRKPKTVAAISIQFILTNLSVKKYKQNQISFKIIFGRKNVKFFEFFYFFRGSPKGIPLTLFKNKGGGVSSRKTYIIWNKRK
jgi:hypothetical protein